MVAFYVDHNVSRAIYQGLRLRDVDLVTAFEDGSHRLPDDELLDRATELGRVLYSSDPDLVLEARRRQREEIHFAGVVFGEQTLPIGLCIEDLELLAKVGEMKDFENSVLFLPLR